MRAATSPEKTNRPARRLPLEDATVVSGSTLTRVRFAGGVLLRRFRGAISSSSFLVGVLDLTPRSRYRVPNCNCTSPTAAATSAPTQERIRSASSCPALRVVISLAFHLSGSSSFP
jgi:hypothetical protein